LGVKSTKKNHERDLTITIGHHQPGLNITTTFTATPNATSFATTTKIISAG